MTIFKLRAECKFDIDLFIKIANLNDYEIIQVEEYPDCEFEFSSKLSIPELKDLMTGVPDSHVMRETIQELDKYTGIRQL